MLIGINFSPNARAKAEVGWRPRYPSYREGLEAILAEKAS
jgi:nucleoside-diphosphate-sugar epimerase